MMGIKSEISKFEELLKEYQLYKRFLDDVSPEVNVYYFLDSMCSIYILINYYSSSILIPLC